MKHILFVIFETHAPMLQLSNYPHFGRVGGVSVGLEVINLLIFWLKYLKKKIVCIAKMLQELKTIALWLNKPNIIDLIGQN